MTTAFSRSDIENTLKQAGLKSGDVVYVLADLRKPGLPAGVSSRDELCRCYFAALASVIGEAGTLVVPTFTPYVLRYGLDFDLDQSHSANGIFSEFIRTHPNRVRSRHPLCSFAAVGRKAVEICGHTSRHSYGLNTPFDRLLNLDAKILAIGLSSAWAMGTPHHLEVMNCVPYNYTKVLYKSVHENGVSDGLQYFVTAAYRNLSFTYDFNRWTKLTRETGCLQTHAFGKHFVHISSYKANFTVASRELVDNPYFFLAEPVKFVMDILPADLPAVDDSIPENVEGTVISRAFDISGDM